MSIRSTAAKASQAIEKPELQNSMVRRRISKACNYCRQRKIKCNGNVPCSNCQNHHIDCIYSKTIRKKKKQPIKKLSLQDLEKKVNKIESKFNDLNDTMNKVLALLRKKNMTLDDKPKSKSRSNSKVFVQSYDDVDVYEEESSEASGQSNEEEEEDDNNDVYDDHDNNDDNNDIDDINEEEDEEDDDEEEDDDDDKEEEADDDNDDDDKLPEKYENYEIQQQVPLGAQLRSSYPISPVESMDSSTNNDHYSVMTPSTAVTSIATTSNDSFSFENNISQFELDTNTLETSIDIKLNFLYNEMPSIVNQLENELY